MPISSEQLGYSSVSTIETRLGVDTDETGSEFVSAFVTGAPPPVLLADFNATDFNATDFATTV